MKPYLILQGHHCCKMLMNLLQVYFFYRIPYYIKKAQNNEVKVEYN